MASHPKQTSPAQPVVTFIVIITLGIVLAVGVNNNENYRLPIILISFVLGFIIAALELRAIVRISRESVENSDSKLSRDEQVARYISDLFEEDIPFDELEENSDQKNNM